MWEKQISGDLDIVKFLPSVMQANFYSYIMIQANDKRNLEIPKRGSTVSCTR